MRLAILTLAYNEEETIEPVIKNWLGLADKHLVLLSSKPWHGKPEEPDKTEEICKRYELDVVKMNWQSETEQRNWGLAYLYDYDYVMVVDADELWLYEDQVKVYEILSKGKENVLGGLAKEHCYRASKVATYWKDTDRILDPPDSHKPIIAVNPKKVLFTEHRAVQGIDQPEIDMELHHLSYCKSDKKIFNKIKQFEHYDQIRKNWYQEIWEGDQVEDVRPYGPEKSRVINKPLPEGLKQLI
jgi:glycosyltransferase involved in cell wall biosynthesis